MDDFDIDKLDDVHKDIIDEYYKFFKMNTLYDSASVRKIPKKLIISSCKYNKIEFIVNELIKQFVSYGIDYNDNRNMESLYLTEIEEYGNKQNNVIMNSVTRQYESCYKLNKKLQKTSIQHMEKKLVDFFCEEINHDYHKKMSPYDEITIGHIDKLLKFNLSMPLRALNTCIPETNMFKSEALQYQDVCNLVRNITHSLLTNSFVEFKFKSQDRQLSRLSLFNRHAWKYQYKCVHDERWLTTEGDDDYLMYLWAGKIGDSKHSFDYFPQCMYPFLCNARNKIIFVYDNVYNKFIATAYIRILQSSENAYLWLENVEVSPCILLQHDNNDDNNDYIRKIRDIIYVHAKQRAKQLHVELITPCNMYIEDDSSYSSICSQKIKIKLDQSDGILETSRYIHDQENWVQMNDEWHTLSCYFLS